MSSWMIPDTWIPQSLDPTADRFEDAAKILWLNITAAIHCCQCFTFLSRVRSLTQSSRSWVMPVKSFLAADTMACTTSIRTFSSGSWVRCFSGSGRKRYSTSETHLRINRLIIEILWHFDSHFDCKHPIRSLFCTCHNSQAVLTCSPLWPDLV